MKRITIIYIIFTILFLYNNLNARQKSQIIIGKGEGDSPPYYYMEKNKLIGLCPDIIYKAASILKVKIVFKEFPWKRMFIYAKTGEIDAVMPIYMNNKRRKFLYFTKEPLAIDPFAFFTNKNYNVKYNGDIREIAKYTIGVVDGFSYGKEIDEAKFLKREIALNEEELIKKFKYKRFKIGIGNPYVLKYYARKEIILDEIIFLKPWISKEKLYLAFSKQKVDRDFVNKFSNAIKTIMSSKGYIKILKKYNLQ